MRWLNVTEEPCDYCAIWIGPHRHSIIEEWDGNAYTERIGIIVEPLP